MLVDRFPFRMAKELFEAHGASLRVSLTQPPAPGLPRPPIGQGEDRIHIHDCLRKESKGGFLVMLDCTAIDASSV